MKKTPQPAKYERFTDTPTREEENALIAKAQAGDVDAYALLLGRYQLYLAKTARKYCGRFVDSSIGEDLLAVAALAFHEALREYDDSRGTRFVTLLWIKARRHLLDEVRHHLEGRDPSLGSLPVTVLDNPSATPDLYSFRYGGIAQDGISDTDVVRIHPDAKLSVPEIPGDKLEVSDMVDRVEAAFDALPDEQKKILRARFWSELTMEEVGVLTGTSRTGARSVIIGILGKLEKELAHV